MGKKVVVSSSSAPAAIGPYSQAIRAGDFVFLSGQIPLDVSTGEVVGDGIETQTRQVMKNMGAVLEAAGASFSDVVKASIFLTDLDNFGEVNKVWGEYFDQDPPARACFQVCRLPKEVLVEVEAVVYLAT